MRMLRFDLGLDALGSRALECGVSETSCNPLTAMQRLASYFDAVVAIARAASLMIIATGPGRET